MTESKNKMYLGDSVYATDHGFQICLTTENGGEPSNEIYLDDQVTHALFRYIEKIRNVKITVEHLEKE